MPLYQFEAKDVNGEAIRDVIEAKSENEARDTITDIMGYDVITMSHAAETNVEALQEEEAKRQLAEEIEEAERDDKGLQ